MEILVVKTDCGLRGLSESDNAAYVKFKNWIASLEAGECFKLEYTKPRNIKFHRKFFALLNMGFEAWEPESWRKRNTFKGELITKNFERFRKDITILAGFYEQVFDMKGRMSLEAKSISFASMDDNEFEKVYSAAANVLLQHVLTRYTREDLDEVVERVLAFV